MANLYDDNLFFKNEADIKRMNYIHNFKIRSQLLSERYKTLMPKQFYRILFPKGWLEKKGEQKKGGVTAIMTVIPQTKIEYSEKELAELEEKGHTKGKAFNRLITDDLEEIGKYRDFNYFSLISPVSYYGRKHSLKNARWLHGLVFDLDDVSEQNLKYLLRFIEDVKMLPKPTMIVNSGGGLHLYYVLDQPIPMLPQYKKALTDFKENLTRLIWTKWTSSNKNIQIHGITQGYRVVGTRTKMGSAKEKQSDGSLKNVEYRVSAWHTGTTVTLDYLNQFVPENAKINLSKVKTTTLSLDKAKQRYPNWYEKVVVQGKKTWGTWKCKTDLYHWWIRKILSGAIVGNRYNCLRLLSAYGLKCGIPAEQVWKDNQTIYKHFVKMTEENDPNYLTLEESAKAYHQYFHPEFIRVGIKTINKLTGFNIEKNKRNGRTRARHLQICREDQKLNGIDWINKDGRPTKKDIVIRWREMNENGLKGTKRQCTIDTGLDKKTVIKWWNAIDEKNSPIPAKQEKNLDNMTVEEKWAMIDELMKIPS